MGAGRAKHGTKRPIELLAAVDFGCHLTKTSVFRLLKHPIIPHAAPTAAIRMFDRDELVGEASLPRSASALTSTHGWHLYSTHHPIPSWNARGFCES